MNDVGRRRFIKQAGVLGTTLALTPEKAVVASESKATSHSDPSPPQTEIAAMGLEALRDLYRSDLYEDYLPFWDAHGIDHDLGGFMCFMDHDGTQLNTDKSMWHQGRGLWVYSYLYNHFGGNQYLEIAQKTQDFLVRHGRASNGEWVESLKKDGSVKGPANGTGFAGMYVAEGLQEFYRATGDQESMDIAIDSFWNSIAIFARVAGMRMRPMPYSRGKESGFRVSRTIPGPARAQLGAEAGQERQDDLLQ